jgi:diguanylate cyclase (GGDEF)-like protein
MMENDFFEIRQLFRTDALTGVGNLIGFYERLFARMENQPDESFSLLSIDIRDLKSVNDNFGRSVGDSTIRWFANVLKEEIKGEAYRIGGDEFAVVFQESTQNEIALMIGKLNKRLNDEAGQANLSPPVANIAVLEFEDFTDWSLVRILGIINHVIDQKKDSPTDEFHLFEAKNIPEISGLNTATLDMIEKLARVGELLDQSLTMAYTDSVSGLPNMNAALRYLENFKEESEEEKSPFSIFLIDGDDLGKYNKISYQQGDEMIKNLGTSLKQGLRPDDYIARWRSGDEFIIVLPNTTVEEVGSLEKRLRERIKGASQNWQYPISISIGAACYPKHGGTVDELIECAEKGLRIAKAQGKDRAAMID